MSRPGIHQLIIGAGHGDAITSMAIQLRSGLRTLGTSEIYARHLGDDMRHEVLPLAQMPQGGRGDVLVYHASFGMPDVSRMLMQRRERLVMVYHNVTPWELFLDTDPEFAASLRWGRHELEMLRDRLALTVAVSDFNRADLLSLGYRNVHVVRAGLRPTRLARVRPDRHAADQLRDRYPGGFVLGVSQVLPHKRFEVLIQAMHLVQWVHHRDVGLVIAGHQRMPKYAEALMRTARQLNVRGVWLTGSRTDAELATCYRAASLFVSTSAHEGLALPPLEAMSFGVPVVAIGSGAIPETIGSAGLVLPTTSRAEELAEAIVMALDDQQLREALVARGRARVDELEHIDPSTEFVQLLGSVL